MTELTSLFEFLRKVFIVTGIIGAIEVTVLFVAFMLMIAEPRLKDRKRHSDE